MFAKNRWIVSLSALIASLPAFGCTDEGLGKKPGNENSSAPSASFGLHVQVTQGGKQRLVRVAPVDLLPGPARQAARFVRDSIGIGPSAELTSSLSASPPAESFERQPAPPGLAPQAEVGTGNGKADSQAQDRDLGWAPGTSLLVWAATSCVKDLPPWDAAGFSATQLYAPDSTNYFIFQVPPQNCDQGLFYQEVLLCAASRLAQVADSVGTVTWNAAQPSNASMPDAATPITVTIPPQATEDRFIARDVAISALAHLARTQLIMPGAPSEPLDRTCSDAYAGEAADGAYGAHVHPSGLIHFPPLFDEQLNSEQIKSVGRARLKQQAAITEGAVGLLQELVEKNFQDDLAGAEKQKAIAADPAGGIAAFWGAPGSDGNVHPYNTMRHALRSIFGRLELGTGGSWNPTTFMDADPRCVRDPDGHGRVIAADDSTSVSYLARGRFRALEVMDALGGGFENRYADVPPATVAQARAISLLEREGILLPRFYEEQVPTAPPESGAGGDGTGGTANEGQLLDYRSAVTAQLLRNAAKAAGAIFNDDFKRSSTAEALRTVMDNEHLSDADLRFAMDRVYGQYLLAVRDFNFSPNQLGEPPHAVMVASQLGLTLLPSSETPELAALGGAVVKDGLSRRALQGDVLSLMAGAQLASDCGYDVDTITSSSRDFARHSAGQVAAFQDVFSLSDILRRQLSVIRDHAQSLSIGDLVKHTDSAVAQTADWAGGRIVHYVRDAKYQLLFANVTPALLGLASLEEIPTRLRLVSARNLNNLESSIFADCVAGTRPSVFCPAASTYSTYAPSAPRPVSDSSGTFAYNTAALELTFDTAPVDVEGFLVTLPQGGAPGQVFGFVTRSYYMAPPANAPSWPVNPPEASDDWFSRASSIVISPQRRRMAEQLFGLRPLDKAQRTCASFAAASLPGDYCLPDTQRDMFVPLANEITSEGGLFEDSWKHYLRVAEEASAKADELGRQLIDLGLQNDERQEGAVETVGELCGAYPNVASISSVDGQVQAPSDSESISSCVGEDLVDLVFFGDDPFGDGDSTAEIKKTFCNPVAPPPNFEAAPFCKNDKITHAGLGLHTPVAPPPHDTACGLLDTFDVSADGASLDKTRFGSIVLAPWASPAGLATTLASLQVRQFEDGEWVLNLRSKPTLASSRDAVSRQLFGKKAAALSAADSNSLDGMKSSVWPWCKQSGGQCTGLAERMQTVWVDEGTDANLATLLRRVERTVFTLGGLVGHIPAGAFKMYLPAIDRPGAATGSTGFTGSVALPVLYGGGHFKDTGGGIQLTGEGTGQTLRSEDATLVANAIAVNQGYVASRGGGGRVLPTWLSSTYTQMTTGNPAAASFLLVPADSPDLSFFDGSPESASTYSPEFSLGRWLGELAKGYSGSCTAGAVARGLNERLSYYSDKKYVTMANDEPEAKSGLVRHVCAKTAVASPVFISASPPSAASQNTELLTFAALLPTKEPGAAQAGLFTFAPMTISGRPGASVTCAKGDLHGYCPNFQWTHTSSSTWGYGNCSSSLPGWASAVEGTCETYNPTVTDIFPTSATRWVQPRVRPSVCPPGERLELFLDKGEENDCQAMQDIVRAMAVSCATQASETLPNGSGPPAIKGIPDLLGLEQWISRVSAATDAIVKGSYVVNIPRAAVDAARNDAPDVGNVAKGTRGQLLLELGKDLNNIEQGIANITNQFRRLQTAVAKVRIDLESIDLEENGKDLSLALNKLENDRQRMKDEAAQARAYTDAVLHTMSQGAMALYSSGGTNLVSALWDAGQVEAEASSDLATLAQEGDILDLIQGNNGKEYDNRVRSAVHTLSETEKEIYAALEGDFTQLQNGRSDALIKINALRGNQSKARIALAKASQADFVDAGDDLIPLPVNTVRRRQFGVLQERYERALDGAKRAAYLARLAIEERLGTRMSDLHDAIGPIEAPSLWVDDLCGVQGIDYNALRSSQIPTTTSSGGSSTGAFSNGPELDLIKGFADQYVGDYVARLKEFVEFYNLEYPFREGSDTALISLREDLGHLQDQCIRESRNLLLFSDQLTATPSDDQSPRDGWRVTRCLDNECLTVRPGLSLLGEDDRPLQPPHGQGAVNWLVASLNDITAGGGSAGSASGGSAGSGSGGSAGSSGAGGSSGGIGGAPVTSVGDASLDAAPPESVYQVVTLRAGQRYIVSWWALARNASGLAYGESEPPPRYSASISDSRWQPIASDLFRPEVGADWGDRSELSFIAPADGDYEVAFGIGQSGGKNASVAIANVQLEAATSEAAGASAYEATNASRNLLSSSCDVDDPAEFRRRFTRRCADGSCWYELDQVLLVDTEVLNQGISSLVGKVSQGNYNYRTTNVALNVIGTGLHDCSRASPSCYGAGYVEYDLVHNAFNVPMDDYLGEIRCFNFGGGQINSGKALAAERYLTVPLSSADSALIEQPAFLKSEFSGRPISGAYRLRIKDAPGLNWESVEDIQLVLNYTYWSRVQRGL